LSGHEQSTAGELVVTFGGCTAPALPAILVDASIAADAMASNRWQLKTGDSHYEIAARSIHIQRDVADEFFAALPPVRARWAGRIGWALLLNILRLPGATRLLRLLRSR
jgi:hypothetical protein